MTLFVTRAGLSACSKYKGNMTICYQGYPPVIIVRVTCLY